MIPSNTYPRGRAITAAVTVDINEEYKAPIQLLQNVSGTDANVVFNGGVAFIIRDAETVVFPIPVFGEITSDQDLIALA